MSIKLWVAGPKFFASLVPNIGGNGTNINLRMERKSLKDDDICLMDRYK
jgi:hypothetical protein